MKKVWSMTFIIGWMKKKFSDVPMDLADASLVVLAEKLNLKKIITIDSDYYVCRTINKEMIENIFNNGK
jgi:uncharacterized protein